MKVADLKDERLDYWVECAEGNVHLGPIGSTAERFCRDGMNDWWLTKTGHHVCGPCSGWPRQYSTDWALGGPIMERERISLITATVNCGTAPSAWIANVLGHASPAAAGQKMLIAGMRAYLVKKYGDEVPEQESKC